MRARAFKVTLMGIAAVAVFSTIVMLLWNALFPAIFGLVTINFWQALGLLILLRILFGGFGGGKHMMFGRHGHGHGKMGENPIHEKWMKMSPEERTEFIKRRKEHMRGGPFGRGDFFKDRFDFDTNSDTKKDE